MNAALFHYTLPLRQPLTLRNQTITARTGLLLKLSDEEGAAGWGDAAPLPGFCRTPLEQCLDAFFRFADVIQGREFFDVFEERASLFSDQCEEPPPVSFAIESALSALGGHGTPFTTALPEIHLSALLTGEHEALMEKAAGLKQRGIDCAKLKVGRGAVHEEAERVRRVSALLGTECSLRLDANRAWDLDTAKEFAHLIKGIPIEYIEEPLRNPEELEDFRADTGLPYALDETLHEIPPPANAKEVMDTLLGARRSLWFNARAWVWKPTLLHVPMLGPALHGLTQAESGPRLVLSAAFESGVGIAALAQYAAAYMEPSLAAGLDTYSWLAEDVLTSPLPLTKGRVRLREIAACAEHIDETRLISMPLLR